MDVKMICAAVSAVGLVALVFFWVARCMRKDLEEGVSLAKHALAHPDELTYIGLLDVEPVTVVVAFQDRKKTALSGVTGVAAVRVFDRLTALTSTAVTEILPKRADLLSLDGVDHS